MDLNASPVPAVAIDQGALRSVLEPVMTIIQGVEKSQEDGKFTMADLQYFMPLLYNATAALTGASKAFADYKQMSGADRQALISWARESFQLKSQNLERKVEAGLAILIEAGAFLG